MGWGAMEISGGIARADPVKVALATLSAQGKSGALFVGPLGSGKTHCVREVVQELSSHQKLSSRTTVVSAQSLRRRDMRGLLLPSAADSRTAHERYVVAADDLDLWSQSMLHLLADAVDRRTVQLVGAIRSASVQRVLSAFRPAASPVIVDLRPWRSSELSLYARTALDTPLHPLTSAAMVEFAGGNPLCLVELLEQGRAWDHLRRRHEVWSWSESIMVPPITFARVWQRLSETSPALLDVVRTLGAFGPLSLPVLSRIHPVSVLGAAEEQDFVVARARPGQVEVALSRPVEGRVALAAAPLLRLRELVAAVLEALSAEGEADARGAAAAGELGMAGNVMMAENARISAAAAALRSHRPQLAAELAGSSSKSQSVEVRVAALVEQGCFREAAVAVAGVAGASAVTELPEYVITSSARAMALTMMTGISPQASRPQATSHADRIDLMCADAWSGHHLQEVLEQGRVLIRSDLEGPRRLRCITATTWAALQLGQVEEGLEVAQLAAIDWDGSEFTTAELLLASAVGVCHLVRGSIKEARSVAARLCRVGVQEQWHLAYACGAFLAGRCALVEARPVVALRRLSEASASLSLAAPTADHRPILQSLGFAYALSGRNADAGAARPVRSREGGTAVGPRIGADFADLAEIELMHLQGRRRAALDLAGVTADRAHAEGATLVGLLALHAVVRLQPSLGAAKQLAELGARTDFALATTFAEHAAAAYAPDAPALQEIAERYESLGMRWMAAETAATALTSADGGRLNAGWAVRAKKILGRLQMEEQLVVPEWWGTASQRVAPLTAREQEIAEAAATGETSNQIAARLHLSRRTVENHLQHVYRKLGVSHREDLALALKAGRSRLDPEAEVVELPSRVD
jgi:DNA-binding CsgD family transcriptional regulator